MTHIVHVLTVADSLVFFEGQPRWFGAQGMRLSFVASPDPRLEAFGERHGVETHGVAMRRKITPLHDIGALAKLWWRLLRERPEIVHGHTPKGGLLGMAAASLAGVPVRIYHIHGLPLATATGWQRKLLWASERMSCWLATDVLCVSRGVREVAQAEGVNGAKPIEVLLNGSINGVDADGRFDPGRQAEAGRAERQRLGIPADALVFGFVGRLVRDKGVVELAQAWADVAAVHPDAHLVVGGVFEERDAVPDAVRAQ
ncbi:MAG: glycosyltransferase, partial [Myxococcota bacterium]